MADEFAVLTTLEAADLLKATEPEVIAEIKAGRLKGFPMGDGWRTTKAYLLDMITGQVRDTRPLNGVGQAQIGNQEGIRPVDGVPSLEQLKKMEWSAVKPFKHQWPKKLGSEDGTGLEDYDEAYEFFVRTNGKTIPFIIGFCNRESAGKADRRRAVIFKGEEGRTLYPMVEFSGANDYAMTGLMASIIRSADKKSVRPNEPVPAGYEEMPLGVYNQIVVGPRSWDCRCVKADKKNFSVMVRHALLRMQGN